MDKLKIKKSEQTKEYYISMPINVGDLISHQVNSKTECIKVGFMYMKSGFVCFLKSICYYIQFNNVKRELIKLQIIDGLKDGN